MKVAITVEREVNITLTEEERVWLHDVMQYQILVGKDQHPVDAEMLKKFFDATTLPTDL